MPILHVKEADFDLRVNIGEVVFTCVNGQATLSYGSDGGICYRGDDRVFDELYSLLKTRRDLRVVDTQAQWSLDPQKTDDYTTEEDALPGIKFASIAEWLGMHGSGRSQ